MNPDAWALPFDSLSPMFGANILTLLEVLTSHPTDLQ